jgi:hypothetical protein
MAESLHACPMPHGSRARVGLAQSKIMGKAFATLRLTAPNSQDAIDTCLGDLQKHADRLVFGRWTVWSPPPRGRCVFFFQKKNSLTHKKKWKERWGVGDKGAKRDTHHPPTRKCPHIVSAWQHPAAPGSTRQHPAVTRQQTRQTLHPAHPGNPANTRQHPGNPATRPGNTRQPGNQGSSKGSVETKTCPLGNEGEFSAPSGCILSPSGTCLRKQSTLHVLITHPCTFTVCLYLCASERAKGGRAANRPKSLRH